MPSCPAWPITNSSCLTTLGIKTCEMIPVNTSCGNSSSSLSVQASLLVGSLRQELTYRHLSCLGPFGVKRDRSATLPRQPRTDLQQFRRQTPPQPGLLSALRQNLSILSAGVPFPAVHAQWKGCDVSPCARPVCRVVEPQFHAWI